MARNVCGQCIGAGAVLGGYASANSPYQPGFSPGSGRLTSGGSPSHGRRMK